MVAPPGALWNASDAERRAPGPGDALIGVHRERWIRAVDVQAPASLTWRWLCQLRAAPYSYDWIDNRGRRSPRQLTPGLQDVAVGDELLVAFTVAAVAPPRSLTLLSRPRSRWLAPFVMDYAVAPAGPHASRLSCRLLVGTPPALPAWVARAALAALRLGDLVMIRRQLLNLKALAERDARAG